MYTIYAPTELLADPYDWGLFGLALVTLHCAFWSFGREGARRYRERFSGACCPLPGVVYGVVWMILNTLLAVALWLTVRHPHAFDERGTWRAALWLWAAFIALCKFWPVFFDMWWTAGMIVLTLITALVNIALIGVSFAGLNGGPDSGGWVVGILFVSLAWLMVATWQAILVHMSETRAYRRT